MSVSYSLRAGVSLAVIVAGSLTLRATAEVQGPPPRASFTHLDPPRGGEGAVRSTGGQGSSDGACGAGLPCDWDGDGVPDCTQSVDPDTMLAGHTVECVLPGQFTQANGLARSFTVPEGGLAVQCVQFGVQQNLGGAWPVEVNLYSGDIEGPSESLELLGTTEVLIPDETSLEFFTATFAEPIVVPPGTSMVVELFIASRNPAAGGDGGLTFLGSNDFGETGPSYIRSVDCGVDDFVTYASLGEPQVHLVMTVSGASDAHTPDDPIEVHVAYPLASGVHANDTDSPMVVYSEQIFVDERPWLRVYFDEVNLPPGSAIRISSKLDGATQILDGAEMAMWGNATAYFNGNMLLIELIAGPHTESNSFTMSYVGTQEVHGSATCPEGPCLLGMPPRFPSSEDWVGRHFPAGCTSNVINALGCAVTAGHCWTGVGGAVIFRVPDSDSDCTINLPTPDHQFPVIGSIDGGTAGIPGQDWRVIQLGPSAGKTHFEKYGVFKPLTLLEAPLGASLTAFGYGKGNPPEKNNVQQQSDGLIVTGTTTITGTPSTFRYSYAGGQISGGNSGGAVVLDDYVVGVVTHCGSLTRIDHPEFQSALATLCAPCTPMPADLSVWWPFDEYDPISGSPEMFTSVNDLLPISGSIPPEAIPGKIGKALDFSSATGPLWQPNPVAGSMSFGTGGGTIAAWINLNQTSAAPIIWTDPLISPYQGYRFAAHPVAGGYRLDFSAWFNGQTCGSVSSGTFPESQWTHVAVTVGPSASGFPWSRALQFYINGQPAGSATCTMVPLINGAPFYVGGIWPILLQGQLDELHIFKRELAAGEIMSLCGNGGTCKMSCAALWDVPFCDGTTSVTSYVTVINKAPYDQTFHLAFAPHPKGAFPGGDIDGPTVFATGISNPFVVPAGDTLPVPVGIQRPVGMISTWQVATFEVTLTSLTGGQAVTCNGSVQDRRDLCAVFVGCCPPFLALAPGTPAELTFDLTNTSGLALVDVTLVVEAFGEDMMPTTALGIDGLEPGIPLVTAISLGAGETAPFTVTLEAPAFEPGVFSIVFSTDIDSDGVLEPLTSVSASIEPAPTCPGDIDGDGTVGFTDLLSVLSSWGPCPGCAADLDGDGTVGFTDLLVVLANWGPC